MMFSVVDARGVILAVLACGVLVAVPGFALGQAFGVGRRQASPTDPLTGIVVGLAILPGLLSLSTRCLGLDAALALDLGLAVAGAVLLVRTGRFEWRFSRLVVGLLVAWLALLVVEWIDIDIGGSLYHPLTVIDTVKHAATTQAILDSGAPPRDAFFLRPERASYYYFFYTLTAVVQKACLGLVDAKSVVGGLIFWVGLGLYGLVRMALARSDIELSIAERSVPLLIVAVLAAGGLDIVAVLVIAWHKGYWLADPIQWNTQISIWSQSLPWVPHHVTALIAAMLGLMAASDLVASPEAGRGQIARNILLAALSFSASLGLSVWVALGVAATGLVWGAILVVERQWRAIVLLALVGVLGICIASPLIADLHAGRSGSPLPIGVTVRAFTPIDAYVPEGPWRMLARLVALPLNYFIEFGLVAVGALLYWRRSRADGAPVTEFGRVLVISTACGLVLGAGLESLIFNNDLGWRITLFPLFAGTVWTIAALDRLLAAAPGRRVWATLPAPVVGLLVLGWATSASTLFSMRAYPLLPMNPLARFMAADPLTDRALRVAYSWANANLPQHNVLQHNPMPYRSFAFSLYGRNPTAVSDRYGALYGADLDAVQARRDGLAPIYQEVLPDAEIQHIAKADRIDDLVVTAADPVWSRPESFVWRNRAVYASARVRIIPVTGLGG